MKAPRILGPGALFVHERFGPETVNRGAVLWECEWDGGAFESGVMLGGIFRAGTFRGGVAWATFWKGGTWEGGLWHHGFGPDGEYRPRGASPGRVGPAGATHDAARAPIDGSGPRATVFAASVFGDLPRLWLACLRRALPAEDVRFELFDDSPDGGLDEALLPGVAVVRRSPARPDFQVAYGDALQRATTPLLVFVDTDVFWLSRDVWPRVLGELENPRVAAVSCVSRAAAASPGTFAVVMRTGIIRGVAARVKGEFAPFVDAEAGEGLPGRWHGADTGDRVARAAADAGFEIRHLDLAATGEFVRFDAITMTRLLGTWVGKEVLLRMAVTNPYFRRGCLGGLALAGLHDGLFESGPRFGAPLPAASLWAGLFRRPRTLVRAARESMEFRAGTARIRAALGSRQLAANSE